MRESYSHENSANKMNIKIKKSPFRIGENTEYNESFDHKPRISSKMMIRNDPKFQSEYNYAKDEHITLPRESRISQNNVPADVEFNKLLHSSQYSSGSAMYSTPDAKISHDKSSAVHVRQSKYTAFPCTIEKPESRTKNSRGLFRAGESAMSHNLSVSQDRTVGLPHIGSEYAPKSSDHYPSASTALGSNSTTIRIRGRNKVDNRKGLIEYSPDEQFVINAKRKEVVRASQRLKKLEIMEKKQLNMAKDEILRYTLNRKKDEEDRKRKRQELLQRRQKLIDERKEMEQRRLKRIEAESEKA